jgi:hypothetical protein
MTDDRLSPRQMLRPGGRLAPQRGRLALLIRPAKPSATGEIIRPWRMCAIGEMWCARTDTSFLAICMLARGRRSQDDEHSRRFAQSDRIF